MLNVFIGENSFKIDHALSSVIADFDGTPEKIDGSTLELDQLSDIILGATLFAEKRLIIIKGMSENKQVWDALPDWIERLSNDTMLVLVEAKPDKRTKTYKLLSKLGNIKIFPAWEVKDTSTAVRWLIDQAKQRKLVLTQSAARHLIHRVGLDQWALSQTLEKLSLIGQANEEAIDEYIEARPEENVFQLLETALRGDDDAVSTAIDGLMRTADPYQTFGLLSSQVMQLIILSSTNKSADEAARNIKVHPFVLSKLAPHAARLGKSRATELIHLASKADVQMKSTGHDPWLLIRQFLIQTAHMA